MCSLLDGIAPFLAVALEEGSHDTIFSVIKPSHFSFQSPAAVLWKGRGISLLMKLHDIGQGTKRRQTFLFNGHPGASCAASSLSPSKVSYRSRYIMQPEPPQDPF